MFAWLITPAHAADNVALLAADLQAHFGIDPGVATAGVIGAVASLAFIREINGRMSMASVLCGVGVSLYFTLPMMEYLTTQWQFSPSWKHAVALMLGLCGFHILAGVYQIGRKWKDDPLTTLKELRK